MYGDWRLICDKIRGAGLLFFFAKKIDEEEQMGEGERRGCSLSHNLNINYEFINGFYRRVYFVSNFIYVNDTSL
jgi:hypothetical protein